MPHGLSGISLETQFLMRLIQPEKSNTEIPPNLNWEILLETARRHSVIPLLNQSLKQFDSEQIPEDFGDRCRKEANGISGRNMVLKRELLSVLHLLQSSGISVIPYKGPALTERLYGNIGLRFFDDLDLLIHKKDLAKVKQLLLLNGFQPKKELSHLSRSQEEAFLEFHYTYDFISKATGTPFEIHWEFVAKSFSLKLDPEAVWNRCTQVSFGNLNVLAFSPEDLLLLLCVMGAKKGWDRLSRIHDTAQALTVYPDIDFDQVVSQARRAGAQRILLVGLILAKECFAVKLPDHLKRVIDQDHSLLPLVNQILKPLFGAQEKIRMFRPEDQFQPVHYRIRENLSDRIRYFLGITFTPSIGEWSLVELPAPMYFLYYLIRPIRLFFKTLARGISR
jgi:hypothetical protein